MFRQNLFRKEVSAQPEISDSYRCVYLCMCMCMCVLWLGRGGGEGGGRIEGHIRLYHSRAMKSVGLQSRELSRF